VSELDRRYRAWFVRASRQLAAEARHAGWFRRRPDLGRGVTGARRLGGGLPAPVVPAAAGGGLLAMLVLTDAGWSIAVVALGLLLSCVVSRLVWRALPARTTLGRAVSAQVAGYRDRLAGLAAGWPTTAETTDAIGRDLPFAVAFGLTRHWTAFAEHKAAQPTIGWYLGDPASLGNAVDALNRATTPSPSRP
jgi:hypothetical protein